MTWGKFAASIILCLYYSYAILAQGKFDPVIHQLGPICEGKIFEIGMLDEFSCFHITFGSRNCASPVPYRAEDRSENIQVTGANPISRRVWRTYTTDGSNYIKVWLYTFKAEKTSEIIITCNSPVDVDIPEGCTTTEKSYVQERTYIYQFEVVPKPPTPSLTVDRYISPGSVNFIATGCPTDKEGYEYRWNENICLENPNQNFYPGDKDGKRIGAGGVYYRVLCSSNFVQCLSDPTDFERGISYLPPTKECIPDELEEQINIIENIMKPDIAIIDPTYHKFPESPKGNQVKICDSSDPNCSVSNVFDVMTSENQFISPIPSDVYFGIDIFKWNKRYTPGNKPVKTCEVVNLPWFPTDPIMKFMLQSEPVLSLSNPIMTYIDRSNFVVINYTTKEHIFSPGRVIRKVVQMCDGVYTLTIGEGKSDNYLGILIKDVNKWGGEAIFNAVDVRLKARYDEKY